VGVVMLVTPGPGWQFFWGLGCWRRNSYGRRLMDRIKREGGKIKDSVLGKAKAPSLMKKKSGSDEAATETTEP
jgi:hypothetical protein